jgi:hypothetical protein
MSYCCLQGAALFLSQDVYTSNPSFLDSKIAAKQLQERMPQSKDRDTKWRQGYQAFSYSLDICRVM